MRISIKTTSGRAVTDDVERLGAVPCFADDFDVGLCVQQHAEARPARGPGRRRGRPGSRRHLGPRRQHGPHAEPAARHRGGRRAVPPRPAARSRMPAMPCPGVSLQHGRAEPVVGDLDLERVRRVGERRLALARRARRDAARWSAIPARCGRRRRRPAAGSTRRRRSRPPRPAAPPARVRATSPSSRAERRHRRARVPASSPDAQHAERQAQLVERVLARGLDGEQRARAPGRDGQRRRARPRRPGC